MRDVTMIDVIAVARPLHQGEDEDGDEDEQDGGQDDESLSTSSELLSTVDVPA